MAGRVDAERRFLDYTDNQACLKYQIGKLDHCHYILITTYVGDLMTNEDLDKSAPPASIEKDLDLEETKKNARSLMKKSSTAHGMRKLLQIEEGKEQPDEQRARRFQSVQKGRSTKPAPRDPSRPNSDNKSGSGFQPNSNIKKDDESINFYNVM